MRYYIAEGPLERYGYQWIYSYYKVYPDRHAKATRFYSDGRIINDDIRRLNAAFVEEHCKEITKEEYESMLEL